MCERKPSGKVHVDQQVIDDYRAGGARREALEMAMLEAIAWHGPSRKAYNRVKASSDGDVFLCLSS